MAAFLAALPALASIGSSIAGAIGKRKKPQAIDTSGLIQAIQTGAQGQRERVGRLRPSLQPLTENLQTGTQQALGEAETANRERSAQFLKDIERTFSPEAEKNLADIISRRVLETQPAQQQLLRESLAATGGLNRGAASRATTQQAGDVAKSLAQAQEDVGIQQQQARQEATQRAQEKIFSLDSDFIQQKLGVNKDLLQQVFNTGRQDLINEAASLLGIDTQEQADIQRLNEFSLGQGLARSTASAEQNNALLNALLKGGLSNLATILAKRG